MITVSKNELSAAFQRWNIDVDENPEEYIEIELDMEAAKAQCENLVSHITEGHQDELAARIRTDVVADFISFCSGQGFVIPDSCFEEFFGA